MSASTYFQHHPNHVHDPARHTHHRKLHALKVKLIHFKNHVGKYRNLINPNHRHDDPHEKRVDERRDLIRDSHRYSSFADVRPGNDAKWYVDGRDYFWAVSVALENATEVIYIADWWLSPELASLPAQLSFLRRPPHHNQEWRLDRVLKRRAEAGVKIYVVVYKEITAALTCDSAHTKSALEALCPSGTPGHGNIVVMRHPDHTPFEHAADMTFYWAHHEKIIVVDHTIAFTGGLDLCFGRWDMKQHPLADMHPGSITDEIWPGQDFNNNRVLDFQKVNDWTQNQLSKADYGRMPWHDVSVGIIGSAVNDVAIHFVGRWNFIKRDKYKRRSEYPWLQLSFAPADILGVGKSRFPVGGFVTHPLHPVETGPVAAGTCKVQAARSASDWSHGILKEESITNAYKAVIAAAQHYVYIENQFFITATGDQQAPIHNTVGKAIVDAVLRAAAENRLFRVIVVIPAIPGFPGDLRQNAASGTRAIIDYQYKSICRGEHSIFARIAAAGVDPAKYISFFNLRAYDRLQKLAAGQDGKESAQKEAAGDGDGQVAEIQERFAVLGAPDHDSIAAAAMLGPQTVVSTPWPGDPDEERDNIVNEELYVHAKVLIADDAVAIIGSANLNDRSQLGDHDSELSLIIEDARSLPSIMAGTPFTAAPFAATLRRTLWREHLGLLPATTLDASHDTNALPPPAPNHIEFDASDALLQDPLDPALWARWTDTATRNTDVFRELFHCDPDDAIETWSDYDAFLPKGEVKHGHLVPGVSAEEAKRRLAEVRGHLVWMPLKFLGKEVMEEKGLGVNAWTESIFT